MSVGLDTMTLIWGLTKDNPRRGNQRQANLAEMQVRSLILLDILNEEKQEIVIPTITVAELLVKVPLDKHESFISEIQSRFFCAPFDLRASAVAARLWVQHRELPKAEQIARSVLKADIMIVATAKVAGVTRFFSHERKCRRLAEMVGLQAFDLPVHHPDMHVDNEYRKLIGPPLP